VLDLNSGRPQALGMVAAFTLVAALPLTDEIGFALTAAFAFLAWRQMRSQAEAV